MFVDVSQTEVIAAGPWFHASLFGLEATERGLESTALGDVQ